MFLAITCILPIILGEPPFEQTLIKHAQGLFLRKSKNSVEWFWRRRFSKLYIKFNIQIVFGYYFANNVGDTTI